MSDDRADDPVRPAAPSNADAIQAARQRAEDDLLQTRNELEARSLELARSLALMQATLESTADAILVTDNRGKIETFNAKFLAVWGLRRDEIEGDDHAALVKRVSHLFRDPQALAAGVESVYASASESLDRLELADGRCFERYSRPQSIGGRTVGRVWSYRDVTARKHAEDALKEEARVLDLLNQTGNAVASSLDLHVLLQTVTDAGTQLSGAEYGAFFYDATDARGAAFQLHTLSGLRPAAFDPADPERATPLFSPVFEGAAPVRFADVLDDPRYGKTAVEHTLPGGHGPVRSYLAVPVRSRSGRAIGGLLFGHRRPGVFDARSERIVVGIAGQASIAVDNARVYEEAKRVAEERARLVATERAARAEIARVSQLKDEFLATLSHELRTPMSAILGWSKALLAKRSDPASLERGLEAIARNAMAQARLIDDLLDMNRIVSGKVRLEVQPLDVASVVEAAVEVVRPSADAKGIRLRHVLDPHAGTVSGDPNRLQQVVWNLLTNAVKFTPKGGRIEVLLERVDSHLELVVRDNGIGIDPQFLPQVFDRFRQADASTTRAHGGLGLGLSIARQLVELHGGSIQAASDGPGSGATFVVCLPLTALRHRPDREHPSSETEGAAAPSVELDLNGVNILVVDDESDTRELVEQLLRNCGAAVHSAGSASEALALLDRVRLDLVLSDIGMPERDGYQFMRELRQRPPERGGRTPAIALTAFARSEDRTRSMVAGYQVHLAKPVEPHELLATVGSLVGRIDKGEKA
ncbi:MAG: ATP-binding protein [Caldimonas sp.]